MTRPLQSQRVMIEFIEPIREFGVGLSAWACHAQSIERSCGALLEQLARQLRLAKQEIDSSQASPSAAGVLSPRRSQRRCLAANASSWRSGSGDETR
jgi:hypothetical protein